MDRPLDPPGPAEPAVEASRIQESGEPHPRHWRQPPRRWPALDPEDPAIADLEGCDGCTHYLAQIQATADALGARTAIPVTDD